MDLKGKSFLVIGGGGAGSRAALEACKAGAKVAIAVKGRYALSVVRGSGCRTPCRVMLSVSSLS